MIKYTDLLLHLSHPVTFSDIQDFWPCISKPTLRCIEMCPYQLWKINLLLCQRNAWILWWFYDLVIFKGIGNSKVLFLLVCFSQMHKIGKIGVIMNFVFYMSSHQETGGSPQGGPPTFTICLHWGGGLLLTVVCYWWQSTQTFLQPKGWWWCTGSVTNSGAN